jgi:hypothetical protein
VCGPSGRPYTELNRLRRDLQAAGIASKVTPVAYEFFRGTSSMLVLKRSAA